MRQYKDHPANFNPYSTFAILPSYIPDDRQLNLSSLLIPGWQTVNILAGSMINSQGDAYPNFIVEIL